MKLNIPYYKQPDNTHCVQACLRMVLKYFFLDKEFSWKELDKLTGKKEGKATTGFKMLMEVDKLGIEAKYFTINDLEWLARDPIDSIKTRHGKNAENLLKRVVLTDYTVNLRKMLKDYDIYERRRPNFDELVKWMEQGWVLEPGVDWGTINNKSEDIGKYSHDIVITGITQKHVFFNDPCRYYGAKDRKISKELFIKAWSLLGSNNALTIYRRKD